MGTPKALLPWHGQTLLGHAIEQARAADVSEVVVVLGPATRHLTPDARTVFNPDPETGRSASIRLAAGAITPPVDAILVQSVDQPVWSNVLRALFASVPDDGIAVPTFGGRRGHPICLSGCLLDELAGVTEEQQGLRAVVRNHAVVDVPVDDESVVWNLNDPAAYAAAHAKQ